MKAEHRHELQTNVLADRVGKLLQGVRSAPKSTSSFVWVFIVLAIVTIGGWQLYARSARIESSALWARLDDAMRGDPREGMAKLEEIYKDGRGTIPGRTAGFVLARLSYQFGIQGLQSMNRNDAARELIEAKTLYARLLGECNDMPLLAQEALMGIAKVEESLIGVPNPEKSDEMLGDAEKARQAYETLSTRFPDSVLGKEATKRLTELHGGTNSVQAFYAELNQIANPKKPEPAPRIETPPKPEPSTSPEAPAKSATPAKK